MKAKIFVFLLIIASSLSAQRLHFTQIKDSIHQRQAAYAKELSLVFVDSFLASDFSPTLEHFNNSLWEKYDSTKVRLAWLRNVNDLGDFQQIIGVNMLRRAEGNAFLVGIEFENGQKDFKMVFDTSNLLADFRIMPHQPFHNWQLPNYVNVSKVKIQALTIDAQLPLLAELSLPIENENPPILVLVHGSGPNDMDETLGPNKIFKDLAYGLASKGIGVLRYNKVSFDHQSEMIRQMNQLTIDQEVTNDAIRALALADSLTEGKVILLGHSLGGHMAPKIAAEANPDGVIVLAGNVSPLENLIIDQFEYLMENDSTSKINEFLINSVKWQINNLKEGNYDSSTTGSKLPFALPAVYWLSLKDYSPTQLAKNQSIPYLILNGGRDYQVTLEEAEKWQNGNTHPQSKTIIYPKMNHLFYAGEDLLLPAEYEKEAHLDEKVLSDMEHWIKTLE